MDTCTAYPKFEADQVLTAEQLNKLFDYLDQQSRWTRKCFVGAGIACGLELKLDTTRQLLHVSGGCGLTTLGYQLKLDSKVCSHYQAYEDSVRYPFFQLAEQQVPLWQLHPQGTFDQDDEDIQRLDLNFLHDKAIVLYLEVEDVDLDTCTGSDCDEKGIERKLCIRILAIEKTLLTKLSQQASSTKVNSLYQQYFDKFQLPELCIGRPHWLGDEKNLFDLNDVHDCYRDILSPNKLAEILAAFRQTYQLYQPLLTEEVGKDPFDQADLRFNAELGIQYFYDHVRNLLLAYSEFCQAAFAFNALCCIPDEGFPKHLMLGLALNDSPPSQYRHHFIAAMANSYAGGDYQTRYVQLLFKRLVLMLKAFFVPAYQSVAVKVTPSQEVNRPLGQRSIPYYYNLSAFPELKQIWHCEAAAAYQVVAVVNFYDNLCVPECQSKGETVAPNNSISIGNLNDLLRPQLGSLLDSLSASRLDELSRVSTANAAAAMPSFSVTRSLQPSAEFTPVISQPALTPYPTPVYPQPHAALLDWALPINPTPRPSLPPSFTWPPGRNPSIPVPPIELPNIPVPGRPIPIPSPAKRLSKQDYPLECDLSEQDFFYIQGVLGKDRIQVMNELQEWVKCYNLPIKLLPLKVAKAINDSDELSLDCRFEDIELTFHTHSQKLLCYLSEAVALLESIQFDREQQNISDSAVTRVTGKVTDVITGGRLADVYYSIPELGIVSKTDSQGEMEFANIPSGNYTVETYLEGYGNKRFPISVKEGKAVDLGAVELKESAYLDQQASYYKAATAEEELRRAADEVSTSSAQPGYAFVPDSQAFKVSTAQPRYLAQPTSFNFSSSLPSSFSLANTPASVSSFSTISTSGYNYVADTASLNTAEAAKDLSIQTSVAEQAATNSPFVLGSVSKQIGTQAKVDLLAATKDYLYNNFANTGLKDTDAILEKLYQPIQLITTLTDMLDELNKSLQQFDPDYFVSKHKQMLAQSKAFIKVIENDRYDDLISEKIKQDIIRQLMLIQQESCFKPLQSLLDAYQARRQKILMLQLLSVYACKHTGLIHMGGTWAGGTYFLVYDDSNRVVLDFALPYICCSDCPPIQVCQGQPIVFKLPTEVFCLEDKRKFKFITNFPGGVVSGPGVSFIETTGEHYFTPSAADVSAGLVTFTYVVAQSQYDLQVVVEDPQIDIKYTIVEVDNDAQTAEVQFSAEPARASQYEWDFGDGDSSNKAAPLKVYKLEETESFRVKLKAKVGVCFASDQLELTFALCNALFSIRELARSADSIIFSFVHPQQVLTREWDMGDGTRITHDARVEHKYELTAEPQEIQVSLRITRETCEDTHSHSLVIPARQEVSIYIDRFRFCRGEVHEYLSGTPANGVWRGPGLERIDGDMHFYPGHPDVAVGENVISYEYGGQTTSITLLVDEIAGELVADVKLIEANKLIAQVHFNAPEELDSISIDLGDGNSTKDMAFTHEYNISERQQFEVTATLIKGACEHRQQIALDLTPCSAAFEHRVQDIANGEIVIEYLVADAGAKEYQISDELGTAKSTQNRFIRAYELQQQARTQEVSISIDKPPCQAQQTELINIPAFARLSINMTRTEFVWCDKSSYQINLVNGEGAKGSGPGVQFVDGQWLFIPNFANRGGDVSIVFETGEQRAELTVNIKRPQAAFSIASINRTDNGDYQVNVQNQSSDFNQSTWLITQTEQRFEQEQPEIVISDVEPGQQMQLSLTVSWDEQCPDSRTLAFQIPIDDLDIDFGRHINRLNALPQEGNFIEIFSPNNSAYRDTLDHLIKTNTELSDPVRRNRFQQGNGSAQFADRMQPILEQAGKQLVRIAEEAPEFAQFGYPLLMVQLAALLDIVTMADKDVNRDHPVLGSLDSFAEVFATLMEFGVDIQAEGELHNLLDTTLANNADKPNVSDAIEKLRIG